jgi:hypothetical protein
MGGRNRQNISEEEAAEKQAKRSDGKATDTPPFRYSFEFWKLYHTRPSTRVVLHTTEHELEAQRCERTLTVDNPEPHRITPSHADSSVDAYNLSRVEPTVTYRFNTRRVRKDEITVRDPIAGNPSRSPTRRVRVGVRAPRGLTRWKSVAAASLSTSRGRPATLCVTRRSAWLRAGQDHLSPAGSATDTGKGVGQARWPRGSWRSRPSRLREYQRLEDRDEVSGRHQF